MLYRHNQPERMFNDMAMRTLKKFALLSASLVVVSGGAIAVNVPAIARDFPEIPLPLVESLTTMPSLFLIVSVLLSHAIARKIGYKRTVLLGMATVLVSGLVPVFVHHFWIIFLSIAFLRVFKGSVCCGCPETSAGSAGISGTKAANRSIAGRAAK